MIETPGASKCIGPGCCQVAQPDSVYCSNDCILKHAAATMKFLSSGKEQKPKPKEKMKMKPEKPSLPKCGVQVSELGPAARAVDAWAREHLLQICWFVDRVGVAGVGGAHVVSP